MTERLQDALKILIFNELKQIKGKKNTPQTKNPSYGLQKKKKQNKIERKNWREKLQWEDL